MRKLLLLLTAFIVFAPALFAQGGLSGISSGATTNVFTNGVFSGAGTPNDPTTGTDLGATAKFVNNTGFVNLKKCGTTDTMCFKVTKETAGGTTGVLTGSAYVDGAFAEADTCSNACVVNNWVKESTTAAGQVMDTGTVNTSPCPSGATCLGFAMTAGSGSQTIVRLSPVVGVSAGGASTGGIVAASGAETDSAAGNTRFLGPLGISADTAFGNINGIFPRAGTITNWTGHCRITTPNANADVAVISLNVNSGTIVGTDNAKDWNNLSNVSYNYKTDMAAGDIGQAVSAGDTYAIQIVMPVHTGTATGITCGFAIAY